MSNEERLANLKRMRSERAARSQGRHRSTTVTPYGVVKAVAPHADRGRIFLSLIVIVVLALAVSAGSATYLTAGLSPQTSSNSHRVRFVIGQGESVAAISQQLEQANLVVNASLFHAYVKLNGIVIQAGTHNLTTDMTMNQIASSLQGASASSPIATVTIQPGWRAEQVAAALQDNGIASYSAVMQLISSGAFNYPFLTDRPAGTSVEGYLLPDTYQFTRRGGAHYALSRILDNFDVKVSPALRALAAQRYGSLFKAVTLASIVQREAGTEHDLALIASVFSNRLADNSGAFKRLDSDPTIQYAVNKGPNWWAPITSAELSSASAYNTRLQAGLPPGPIAEPSLSALSATISPASTQAFYFYHVNGSHGQSIFCTAQQGPQCGGTPQ